VPGGEQTRALLEPLEQGCLHSVALIWVDYCQQGVEARWEMHLGGEAKKNSASPKWPTRCSILPGEDAP
jgi:hypothetical protein